MNALDLVGSAVVNTFRAKTRTVLTILAIFVGAFTLTLTNGLGTGVNAYIDDTVSAIGAADVMTVTKDAETARATTDTSDSGPAEYDPDTIATDGPGGQTVTALTPADLDTLAGIDGVLAVQATKSVSADYVEAGDGTKYVVSVGGVVEGQTVPLAAGQALDDASEQLQVVLPQSYVEPLGFTDDEAALGQTVILAVTDAERTQHEVEATVVGISEPQVAAFAGDSATPNDALTDALYTLQNTGVPADQVERYSEASATFDADATDEQVAALKDRLAAAGYTGTTVADQLGTLQTVIDGIVLLLNAFAVIALIAASFGIVNTLYMSVQERTREIGLMKAMGMGSGRVFSLFSLEAAFIGLLGSALGAVVAIVAGSVVSSVLSGGLLASLGGLTLIAFDPSSIAVIILVVMAIALLAGTLPAARAARADPVTSLRYE